MKKIFIITSLLLLVASSAFATALTAGGVTGDEGLSIYGGSSSAVASSDTASTLLAKCSKGVRAGANFDSTHYAINTKHDSGNKAFGTSYDSTAIYNSDLGTGALTAAPTAMNSTAFTTWTEM